MLDLKIEGMGSQKKNVNISMLLLVTMVMRCNGVGGRVGNDGVGDSILDIPTLLITQVLHLLSM